ncbi:hypothetical protein G4177_16125 [Corallococcus sp. ZKHCc1 1396]|uniref:Uncharacterized protein n=1 Tax=Corallococcus soli TaxID=2710757 RepID=A0ABR9PPA8_9BACT|nr:hypothetical protein [Corallococcus soli]MBE4749692.1 hypothetical protein [Corallococcus soli]
MQGKRLTGPVEALRNLSLSLARLAASEAATGAVHGSAEGLRKEMPELDGQLRALLQDVLTVLGRLAHEAAEREHVAPADAAHLLAGAAMEGALKALEREWNDGGLPLHAFMVRINHLFDEALEFAHSRTDEIRKPGERAQAMSRGVVKAAMEQLHEAVPLLLEDARALAPLGEEVASRVGQGLVRGMAAGLREELASSPAVSRDALVASLEEFAQRAASATVRGAGSALEEEGLRWREAPAEGRPLRRVGRDFTAGVLEALGSRLRRPLLAMAGAGSALVVVTVLAARWGAGHPR